MTDGSINEPPNELYDEPINGLPNELTDRSMNEPLGELTNRSMNEPPDGLIINGLADELMTNGLTSEPTDD
jgi:hypothetical protein